MATWFARQTANINAANVWNSTADGSGSWLTWPPAAGDVLMANSFTLTVNADVLLGASGELRNDTANGATAGGQFTVTSARTITGHVYQGGTGTRCIEVSGASANLTLTGNVYGGSGSSMMAIRFLAGTLSFTGNAYGGTGSAAHGIYQTGGSLTFTGNMYGGAGPGASTSGLSIVGATAVTITGNAYGGNGNGCTGLSTSVGTFTVNVTGNAYGGTGATATGINNGVATCTINLTGNAIANDSSSSGYGVQASATSGPITISGYAQATTTSPAVLNSGQAVVTIGETRSASNGRGAVLGAFRFASATAAKSLPIVASTQKTLSVLDVAALVPAVEDVRAGVTYGDGAYTGTLTLRRKRASMAGRF